MDTEITPCSLKTVLLGIIISLPKSTLWKTLNKLNPCCLVLRVIITRRDKSVNSMRKKQREGRGGVVWCSAPLSTLQYLRYLGTGDDYSQSSVSNISYRNTEPLKSVLLQEEKRLIQLRKSSNTNSFSLLFYYYYFFICLK